MPFTFAHANDLARVQSEIAAERKRSQDLDKQLRASDRNVARTQRELVQATAQMSELESEQDRLGQRMKELKNRDAELRRKIESNQASLRETAAALLQIASQPTTASLAAGESLSASILLSGIADRFDAELRESEAAMKELSETQTQMARQQRSVDASAKKLTQQKTRLDGLMKTRSAQSSKLRAQSGASEARLKELAARAKSIAELSDNISGTTTVSAASMGRLKTPVRGMLLRGFGDRSALGMTSDGWHIRTRRNETVIAPDDAFVEFADNFRGRNIVLILNHRNGYYTVLAQLEETSVIAGQTVMAGEPVGRMGATNPELYLELRRAKRAIDPARHFNKPKGL